MKGIEAYATEMECYEGYEGYERNQGVGIEAYAKGIEAYAKGIEAYAKGIVAYAKGIEAYAKGIEAYAKGIEAYAKGMGYERNQGDVFSSHRYKTSSHERNQGVGQEWRGSKESRVM